MDVICIDDIFSTDCLKFYSLHGVVTPVKDTMYTIRGIDSVRGTTGLYLEEIVNPKVPIQSPAFAMTGSILNREPSFHIKRFSTLGGEKINEEELKQILEDVTKN